MKRLIKYGIFSVLFFYLPTQAEAACTLTTTAVNFGNYNVFSPLALNSTGSVTVSCSAGSSQNMTISIGPSPNSGGFIPRKMKHATLPDMLSYNVYINAAGTSVWGNGTGGTSTVFLNRVRRRPQTVTVYGIIPPLQNVTIGSYSDLLTVTFTP
ncbi:MAG: spore coat protein U domain-containing protein [Nitrospirae bacterium]|nr:spore coat protein U domain-containing protein [Nitrospirota bacterium]